MKPLTSHSGRYTTRNVLTAEFLLHQTTKRVVSPKVRRNEIDLFRTNLALCRFKRLGNGSYRQSGLLWVCRCAVGRPAQSSRLKCYLSSALCRLWYRKVGGVKIYLFIINSYNCYERWSTVLTQFPHSIWPCYHPIIKDAVISPIRNDPPKLYSLI